VAIRIEDLDTDPDSDLYRDAGKPCLGGGMHCPSASSLLMRHGYEHSKKSCFMSRMSKVIEIVLEL